jgi:hypothetical protein
MLTKEFALQAYPLVDGAPEGSTPLNKYYIHLSPKTFDAVKERLEEFPCVEYIGPTPKRAVPPGVH